LTIETNPIGHLVPSMIEVISLTLVHATINVMLLSIVANSLLYNFTALTIQHSLMGHLLVTCV
jgi:hypothetical protein